MKNYPEAKEAVRNYFLKSSEKNFVETFTKRINLCDTNEDLINIQMELNEEMQNVIAAKKLADDLSVYYTQVNYNLKDTDFYKSVSMCLESDLEKCQDLQVLISNRRLALKG